MNPPLGGVLRQAAHEQLLRGLRVDEEIRAVAEMLRDGGIRFAVIKGPARRIAAELYPYADARSTSDVDLLVPEAQGREAWQILVDRGYERATEPEPWQADHFHLPPLWNQRRVAVELHTSTAPWLTPSESWERESTDCDTARQDGIEFEIASATELLWHGMAHAFIDGAEGFRLRTFLDGAVVIGSQRPIDWSRIEHRITGGEIRDGERGGAVSPRLQRRWIATAGVLAGIAVPEEFAVDGCYPLSRILRWKALALQAAIGRAARERLLEEGIRSETGMALTPSPADASRWAGRRRRIASAAARAGYIGWRTLRGGSSERSLVQ